MQSAGPSLRIFESSANDIILGKLAFLDGLVDTDDVLPDDPSRSDVQVSDLRVAHQALRQTDSQRRGLELDITRLVLGKAVHDGCVRGGDGVAILW